ncbi:MAG: ABC transporter substrate-binding protein [Clostridiales bacterium]|nr:ABC transporter substrate-binding protein [Clostridiales bacterium]
MKKTVKILSLVLALVMALALCACGTQPADDPEKPADTDAKVLTMGTNASFPPYEYYDGDQIVGIDAEIAAAIAEKLGMQLSIEDMDFNAIIPSVVSGKVDMGMAGMTVTEERLQSVSFSTSYATGVQAIIVREDSEITSPDDITALIEAGNDIQIGAQEATTGYIYASDTAENGGFGSEHVQAFKVGADAVAALVTGKIDCVIIDNEPAKAYVAANEGLKILDSAYVTEDYAIAIAQGNAELLEQVNGALEDLIADGTVQSILDKYINAD